MTLIAVEIIDETFSLVKKVITPISFKRWAKLSMITFLSGYRGISFPTVRMPATSNLPELWYIFLIPMLIIGGLVGLVFSYFSSVFLFILLNVLHTNNMEIRTAYRKYHAEGVSLFKYRALMMLLFLLILLIFGGGTYVGYQESIPLLLASVVIGVIVGIIALLFDFVVGNTVPVIMYKRKMTFTKAFKYVWPVVLNRWGQVVGYITLHFILGFGAGIIMLVLILLELLAFGLIGLVFFGVGYLLYNVLPILLAFLVGIGVIVGLLLLVVFSIITVMTTMPVTIFFISYMTLFTREILRQK